LLLPTGWEREVEEMRSAKHAIVSRGPFPQHNLPDAVEILLDDGSDSPYSIDLAIEQCNPLPTDEDAGKEWVFAVWTAPRRGKPHKAMERPCYYRRVASLPCLEPFR
jgi:hypothetical protein